ncbi:MAG: CopG family transcriptional regulator [Zetaproteobacteria bacterium CG2_30_46_52]|nr:MAG: CopG family transcriptional regulator [Zetaproteobacteria bacterium CG2_30_46_52]
MAQATSKRSTIYLEENIHKTLRLKAAETHRSISDLVNEAVRLTFIEDQQDLAEFEAREAEPSVGYEAMLKALKADGII